MSCLGPECMTVRKADEAGLIDADTYPTMVDICERVSTASGKVAALNVCPFALGGSIGGTSHETGIQRIENVAQGGTR